MFSDSTYLHSFMYLCVLEGAWAILDGQDNGANLRSMLLLTAGMKIFLQCGQVLSSLAVCSRGQTGSLLLAPRGLCSLCCWRFASPQGPNLISLLMGWSPLKTHVSCSIYEQGRCLCDFTAPSFGAKQERNIVAGEKKSSRGRERGTGVRREGVGGHSRVQEWSSMIQKQSPPKGDSKTQR